MSRIAYVNGRYLSHTLAAVHVEDRGFQFADGVYEVIAVRNSRLVDEGPHLDRLARSLAELSIDPPMGHRALSHVMHEVVRRNRVKRGILYLQVTRGVAKREHVFPAHARPSLVVTARASSGPPPEIQERGCAVISLPDIRWKRCDIKSVALLANVLAKERAREQGAFEALLVDEAGFVTEASAANVWIVSGSVLLTRPAGDEILEGITRRAVMALAEKDGLDIVERAFTVAEAKAATEAFLTGTTAYVLPVTRIDGEPVGSGVPGPFTRRLMAAYLVHADSVGKIQ